MKLKEAILQVLKTKTRPATKRQLSIILNMNIPAAALWELEEQDYIQSDSKFFKLKTIRHIRVAYTLTNKGRQAVGLKPVIKVERQEDEMFVSSYW